MKAVRNGIRLIVGLGLLAGAWLIVEKGYGWILLVGAVLVAGSLILAALGAAGRRSRQEEFEEARAAAIRNNPSNRARVEQKYKWALETRDRDFIVGTMNLIASQWGSGSPEYKKLQKRYVTLFGEVKPSPSGRDPDTSLFGRLYGHLLGDEGDDFESDFR